MYSKQRLFRKAPAFSKSLSILLIPQKLFSAVPFAAGIACIEKMKKINCPALLQEKGNKLRDGLIAAAKDYSFDLHVSGISSLFYLRIADDPSLHLHQEWIAECVKRGIFFTNHHNHFINASLSDEDIAETVEVAREAFDVIRSRHPLS